jgi:hypothetical protein
MFMAESDELACPPRPHIGRAHHHIGPTGYRLVCKPPPQGYRLALSEVAQRNVHVPLCDVETGETGRVGGLARDIARTFSMTHNPQPVRPTLLHRL